MSSNFELVTWENIPPVEGMPHGCAWGVWGKGDQLGALNLLTPANTLAAMKESRSGTRIQLDWQMDCPKYPSFNRRTFEHTVLYKDASCDDVLHYNTQSSSQWDGFKHIAHPATQTFYNGLQREDIVSGKEPLRNGIHNWVQAGGIAGRGILLDWARWYSTTHPGKPLPAGCTSHGISIAELEEVAKFQSTEFKVGDILIVRSGFIKWYNEAEDSERKRGVQDNGWQFIGVASGEATKKWIWDHHFAAVAGDTVAFEQFPITDVTTSLHHWLLPMAGITIGELFNLEDLSEACARENKWSFFFTSAPLNVPGGVASSPNAIAIL